MNQKIEERRAHLNAFVDRLFRTYSDNGPFSFHKPRTINLRALYAEVKKRSDTHALLHIELQFFALCSKEDVNRLFPVKAVMQ